MVYETKKLKAKVQERGTENQKEARRLKPVLTGEENVMD